MQTLFFLIMNLKFQIENKFKKLKLMTPTGCGLKFNNKQV